MGVYTTDRLSFVGLEPGEGRTEKYYSFRSPNAQQSKPREQASVLL
jgi:hypothetical protein